MTSMNGRRMWKPAPSVPVYLPRRSTTYALCCGTTTAVRASTYTTSAASPRTTIKLPVMNSSACACRDSLRANPDRKPVDTLDATARILREQGRAAVASGPRRAAQLRFADSAARDILGGGRGFADQTVDAVAAGRCEPHHHRAAEEREGDHGEHGEEQPLEPIRSGQADCHEKSDAEGADSKEHQIEAAVELHLEDQQHQTEEHPQPPRHDHGLAMSGVRVIRRL